MISLAICMEFKIFQVSYLPILVCCSSSVESAFWSLRGADKCLADVRVRQRKPGLLDSGDLIGEGQIQKALKLAFFIRSRQSMPFSSTTRHISCKRERMGSVMRSPKVG